MAETVPGPSPLHSAVTKMTESMQRLRENNRKRGLVAVELRNVLDKQCGSAMTHQFRLLKYNVGQTKHVLEKLKQVLVINSNRESVDNPKVLVDLAKIPVIKAVGSALYKLKSVYEAEVRLSLRLREILGLEKESAMRVPEEDPKGRDEAMSSGEGAPGVVATEITDEERQATELAFEAARRAFEGSEKVHVCADAVLAGGAGTLHTLGKKLQVVGAMAIACGFDVADGNFVVSMAVSATRYAIFLHRSGVAFWSLSATNTERPIEAHPECGYPRFHELAHVGLVFDPKGPQIVHFSVAKASGTGTATGEAVKGVLEKSQKFEPWRVKISSEMFKGPLALSFPTRAGIHEAGFGLPVYDLHEVLSLNTADPLPYAIFHHKKPDVVLKDFVGFLGDSVEIIELHGPLVAILRNHEGGYMLAQVMIHSQGNRPSGNGLAARSGFPLAKSLLNPFVKAVKDNQLNVLTIVFRENGTLYSFHIGDTAVTTKSAIKLDGSCVVFTKTEIMEGFRTLKNPGANIDWKILFDDDR